MDFPFLAVDANKSAGGETLTEEVHLIFIITTPLTVIASGHRQSRQANHQGSQIPVRIGGLFDSSDSLEEATLKAAVKQINSDQTLLRYHRLTLKAETLADNSSFYTANAACRLLREGIVGIFGPQNANGAAQVQSLCDSFDIPHIETQWDYRIRQDKYAINLFPHPDTLGEAYLNLVNQSEWNNFAVLYDDAKGAGVFKLQSLIRASMLDKRNITVRQLPSVDFRPLLKTLQKEYHIRHFVVDTDVERTLEILRQAEQIGMTMYDYSYILTSLDLQAEDMNEYKHGEGNFFAFRLVDPDKRNVQASFRELAEMAETLPSHTRGHSPHESSSRPPRSPKSLTTSQALVFDAVRLFSRALDKHSEMIGEVQRLHCNQNEGWTEGSTLLNAMQTMPSFHGLTGMVQLNTLGFRTDINMDIMKVTKSGWVNAGTWKSASFSNDRITWFPLEPSPTEEPSPIDLDELPLRARTLRVTTFLNDPFCMLKQSMEAKEHNDRYEGYAVDLVDELSKLLGFNYTIQIVADGTYPGMIKEVKDKLSDMVVADLSVTKDRQEILDFTMPFMNLGISILFVPPQARPPELFSFMSPFAFEVWVYMAFSFFGVSLVLFFVARITPIEWDNPLPCITDPSELQNQFKVSNSIWFTLGSIMQQGSDLAPKAVSTRIIAGIWWFFTLIMVSSYTANLATFLIVQELDESIKTLSDLAKQQKIEYGCYEHGSTAKFFSESNDTEKTMMWTNMRSKFKNALKASNTDGINAVREDKGKYAFFMESTLIEYNIERKCNLAQVGGLLDNKGYGIALRKESRYMDELNGAILKFQENGKLDELKRKWWKEQRKELAEQCQAPSVSDSVNALGLANVGGVFVVLVVGCVSSIFITCLEIYLHSKTRSLDPRLRQGDSRMREILKDLQFALQCRGNVKPVRRKSRQSIEDSREELGSTPYFKYASNKSLAD